MLSSSQKAQLDRFVDRSQFSQWTLTLREAFQVFNETSVRSIQSIADGMFTNHNSSITYWDFFLDLNLFVPLITRLNCKLPQKNFISLQNHSKHAKDIVWQRKMYSLYCQVMCDKLTCSQSINSNTAAAKTVTLWTKLQTSNYRDDNSVCWCWQEA